MQTRLLVGITISLLLLVLPAAASDYTLGIFGNANEDDTINMQDVTYTELIILEYRDKTELADGKYDGKINMQDVTQIELVILGKEKEITLIDAAERGVTIKKPVERAIVFNFETVEALRSIDAADRIVGVGDTIIHDEVLFSEFDQYPNVGKPDSPDIEKVLELQPDVVFVYPEYFGDDLTRTLESLDVTVVRVGCYELERYEKEIIELGYTFNRKAEAEEFLDFYQEFMDTINERVEGISEGDKPRVYLENWNPYWTCSEGASWHTLLVAAGGANIFAGETAGTYPEYPVTSAEAVIERDPEIIIVCNWYYEGCYCEGTTSTLIEGRDEMMSRPELARVTAVEEGAVYVAPHNLLASGRFFVGVGYMAKWFHPELFEDLDPTAVHQEFLTRFQGLDIDLDDVGACVYPEPSFGE